MKSLIRQLYIKTLRSKISDELTKQRLKLLLWDMFVYYELMGIKSLSRGKRLWLIWKCLLIDWNIQHVHKPCEVVPAMKAIAKNKRQHDEIVLEAGAWMGGMTAKLSLVAGLFNYPLYVFDSFEGAYPEQLKDAEENYYVGPLEEVKENTRKYGNLDVCIFVKGWFSDTLKGFDKKVKLAYLDCEKLQPTKEVLEAIAPNIMKGGEIYVHDYQKKDIREMINSDEFWKGIDVSKPYIVKLKRNPVKLIFREKRKALRIL